MTRARIKVRSAAWIRRLLSRIVLGAVLFAGVSGIVDTLQGPTIPDWLDDPFWTDGGDGYVYEAPSAAILPPDLALRVPGICRGYERPGFIAVLGGPGTGPGLCRAPPPA